MQGPSSKSLLIQTVALFEALLARIKDLQQTNQNLQMKERIEEADQDSRNIDNLILEIEKLNLTIIAMKQVNKVNIKFIFLTMYPMIKGFKNYFFHPVARKKREVGNKAALF